MSKLMHVLRDMGLKMKLLLLYAGVFLLPLSILTFYSTGRSRLAYSENLQYMSEKSFEQACSYLSFRFDRIARLFTNIQLNQRINELFIATTVTEDTREQIQNLTTLRTYLNSITDDQESIHPKLYLKGNEQYISDGVQCFSMGDYMDTAWMQTCLQGWGWLTFCSPTNMQDTSIISMVRPIRNLQDYTDILGVVRVDISSAEIREMLRRAAPTPDSLVYIVDYSGQPVLASDNALFERLSIPAEELMSAAHSQEHRRRVMAQHGLAFLETQPLPRTNWMVASLTAQELLNSGFVNAQKNLLLVVMLILLTGVGLSLPLVNNITKGIFVMDRRMKRFQEGDYRTRFTPNSRDEIGNLMRSFNLMLARIEGLADEQYALGKDLQVAEMMALQSQINPHFLYNTLDLINWMIAAKKESEAQRIVLAMARFYRLSLSRGKDVISISEEADMLRNYVLIQQARFRDSITLVMDLQEVLAYAIPKITLQPIVENAILHGIMETQSKQGTIRIAGRLQEGEVIIDIVDDGVGMQTETLEKLLAHPAQPAVQASSSYGLYNVNRRLCLCFGIARGLYLQNEQIKGVWISLRFPAVLADGHHRAVGLQAKDGE